MATGFTLDGFPSMGAWVTYALGSEDETLPAYVAIPDPRGAPQSSGNFWGPGFLPAAFQGTDFNAPKPVRNLARPGGIIASARTVPRAIFLATLNRHHLRTFPGRLRTGRADLQLRTGRPHAAHRSRKWRTFPTNRRIF